MHGAELTLYNSITRSLERFEPLDPDKGVRVYSCGPTVYSDPHLGNLRAYVFTDTLSRVLSWKGYALTHVINITDVGHLTSDADAGDDKMEAAAKKRGQSAWDIARHYADVFRRNLADLNIRTPTHMPLATDYVPKMIAFAEDIAAKHCYELDSGLYFDSSTVPDYGRLAGSQDDQGEARIDPVAGKRHPQDFAIWRKTPADETRQMEWDSPWGRGAPGWHLECSVMSSELLGLPFDIHTGGIDHREIHHVNEIAQNQAHCGCGDSGARFWMHNNFLVDRGGKMSKSKGGIATLDALVGRAVHPLAYRLMCISAHYRSELEFSTDNLLAATKRLQRLVLSVAKLGKPHDLARLRHSFPNKTPANSDAIQTVLSNIGPNTARHIARFDAAISHDLNTPEALPIIEDLIKDNHISKVERLRGVAIIDEVLGLGLLHLTRRRLRVNPARSSDFESLTEDQVTAMVKTRLILKKAGRYDLADAIRQHLSLCGVDVMDGDPLRWDWSHKLYDS